VDVEALFQHLEEVVDRASDRLLLFAAAEVALLRFRVVADERLQHVVVDAVIADEHAASQQPPGARDACPRDRTNVTTPWAGKDRARRSCDRRSCRLCSGSCARCDGRSPSADPWPAPRLSSATRSKL